MPPENSTANFVNPPQSAPATESTGFGFNVNLGSLDAGVETPATVDVTVQLSVGESPVASASDRVSENDSVTGTLTHSFEEDKGEGYPRKTDVTLTAEIDYFFPASTEEDVSSVPERDRELSGPGDPYKKTDTITDFSVKAPPEQQGEVVTIGGENAGKQSLSNTFQDRTPFSIKQIVFEDDADYLNSVYRNTEQNERGYQISFEYSNPDVAIDTSGRFAKHEIIGGSTVRQKIGEDPINVSINGVCKRRAANQIDTLRDAKTGKIFSDRLPGSNDSLLVQFGSTTTEPMESGTAADLTDGKELYTFQINCIEVIR